MTAQRVIPDPRAAWRDARTGPQELLTGGLLLAAVAIGTWAGMLPGLALLAVGAIGVVAAVSSPRVFLLAYVAFIPFEGSTAFGGITNLSRFAGIAFAGGYLIRRRTAVRLDVMPVAGWALVLFAAASYLWSIDRTASLPQILTLLQLFLVAVLIADYVSEEEGLARWVALAYAVSAVATGLIGLFIWVTSRSTLAAGRATAFAGQDAAQFTSVLIPGLLVLFWETIRRPRVLPVIGAVVIVLAILASGTRSAWVAIGLAVAAGILPRISTRQRLTLVLAVGSVAIVALVVPSLYAETYGRAHRRHLLGRHGPARHLDDRPAAVDRSSRHRRGIRRVPVGAHARGHPRHGDPDARHRVPHAAGRVAQHRRGNAARARRHRLRPGGRVLLERGAAPSQRCVARGDRAPHGAHDARPGAVPRRAAAQAALAVHRARGRPHRGVGDPPPVGGRRPRRDRERGGGAVAGPRGCERGGGAVAEPGDHPGACAARRQARDAGSRD
ncbi:MAG: hypothetical protein U0838_04065 [Chloroflexota bacterium]